MDESGFGTTAVPRLRCLDNPALTCVTAFVGTSTNMSTPPPSVGGRTRLKSRAVEPSVEELQLRRARLEGEQAERGGERGDSNLRAERGQHVPSKLTVIAIILDDEHG